MQMGSWEKQKFIVKMVTEADMDERVCFLNCQGPLPVAESRGKLTVSVSAGVFQLMQRPRPTVLHLGPQGAYIAWTCHTNRVMILLDP